YFLYEFSTQTVILVGGAWSRNQRYLYESWCGAADLHEQQCHAADWDAADWTRGDLSRACWVVQPAIFRVDGGKDRRTLAWCGWCRVDSRLHVARYWHRSDDWQFYADDYPLRLGGVGQRRVPSGGVTARGRKR